VRLDTECCAEADFKKLTDFRISVVKPLTPRWLRAGWKRIADDPEMVVRGWQKCGLRAPFDDSKEEVLQQAQLAMTDSDHPLFPLFPNGDRTQLPPEVLLGEAEPEMDQAGAPDDDAEEGEAASDDENTALRVRALLAPEQALQQAAVAQPVRSSGVALYPMFNLAARTQRS
jgi:hypothetical protein